MNEIKALIVEDDPIIVEIASSALEQLGYQLVGIAESQAEAMALFCARRPQVVLMDIQLGDEGDGVEAAREMRRLGNACIVFLTSHADSETIRRARDADPDGYVVKPFERQELERALDLGVYRRMGTQRRGISEVVVAEHWLSAVMHSVDWGIVSFDLEGNCKFANASALSILDFGLAESSLHEILHGVKEGKDRCKQCVAVHNRVGTHVAEAAIKRADGRTATISYTMNPIVDRKEVLGVVCTLLPPPPESAGGRPAS